MSSAPASASRARRITGRIRPLLSTIGFGLRVAANLVAGIARTVWVVVQPKLSIIGPVGWIVLAVAAISLGAGLALGWAEFTYLGATLIGAMLISTLFLFGRSNYSVDVAMQPPRVVVGERALGSMTVTNIAGGRSLPTRMELPVGAAVAEFTIPALPKKGTHEELFGVPTNRRAVIVAGPAVTVRGDAIGLLRRSVRWTEQVELFVHPVVARLASTAAGLVHDLEGEITKNITANDISFHALRAYQPGDPLRNVHWRTSARTGQLMVRQFEESRRSQLLVVFSTEHRFFSSDDEFELAVSVMASIAVQVIRDGTKISVVSEGHSLHTLTPVLLLDDSCRLQPVNNRYRSVREFAREASSRLPSPSVVMVVAGSNMDIAEARTVGTLFGDDTRRVVVRVELGAAPRVAKVSDITVITVGSLSDLPKLMRRVQQ
jgi:hypothetical protein